MVFRFRMISSENEDFFRDFEIRDEQTFFDFHCAIQDELGFDHAQLASFFLSNKHWEKGLEITLCQMDDAVDEEDALITMDMARLSDYVTRQKQHLLYVFDFFSERAFFLELVNVKEDNTDKKYPVCIERRGEAPAQIMIDDDLIIGDLEEFNIDDELLMNDDFLTEDPDLDD